jgi:Family of unknown function (DUF6519)
MHGDYSRGHEPDRKRGRDYRRVLLQMGRPVLDSDVASMVDALLGEVRATTRGLSCAAGSPDLGFLITPGRLLSVFAEAQDELTAQGDPHAWIDYRFRYAERYPALHVAANGSQARVTLPLLQPLDPTGAARVALWARVEEQTTVQVNGIPVTLVPESPPGGAQRFEFATGGASLNPLEITLDAGEEAWFFLLEQDEAAGAEPGFWIAPGSYHVDGLVTDARGGGRFPAATFPEAAGFPWDGSPPGVPLDGLLPGTLGAGARLVAYLETWERHITAIEDPGIREEALGSTDTTTRTELLGQVKLATVTGALPPGAGAAGVLREAFDSVQVSGGRVTIEVPETTPTTDPCALPELAGYSGSDNRLYRVEVHRGGGLSTLRLKWSRDNGSELFAAQLDSNDNLVFPASAAPAAGDLVEVLSHVVDLGDDAVGQVSAGGFTPPRRAVGQLAQLVAVDVAASSDEVVFRLVDPDNVGLPVTLDDRYGDLDDAVLKLRRWHGILDPGQSPGPFVLEDGISVELSTTGSYLPGQYWQYEARVRGENANGPWRDAPHGPERRFAPLALLEFQGGSQPLRLLAWLDERFSHPCDLGADDVAFTGDRVGMASDTVQEALEELWERPAEIVDASCGELIIRPENGDLQAVFDTIPEEEDRRICIQPGQWVVDEPVVVSAKGDLIISGAGDATTLVGMGDTVLRFELCRSVRIQDLTVAAGLGSGPPVVGDGLAGAIAAIDSNLELERVSVTCESALTRRVSAVEVRRSGPVGGRPRASVRNCRLSVGAAQVGLLVVDPASVVAEGNTIIGLETGGAFPGLADPALAGRVGRLLIGDEFVGETEEANDELLVGSNDVLVEADPAGGRRRFIVHTTGWGNQFVTFSTTLPLGAAAWRTIFDANPIPGDWFQSTAPAGFVYSNVRKFRRRVMNAMFNRPDAATVPGPALAQLRSALPSITSRHTFTPGGQGIVVAGLGTAVNPAFPEPRVLTDDPAPDVLITGNRIVSFLQGIHVGTSGRSGARGVAYRVTVRDNVIHLHVPGLAGERHGIFVGSVFHLCIEGNTVEMRRPAPSAWSTAPPTDAIRAQGLFGPLIQIRQNSAIGTSRGVVAHATNPSRATNAGWRWMLADNAHVSAGPVVPETDNW